MKKSIIGYSAPAKVILSGEHSVVYGKPALVCAVDLRLNFTIKKIETRKNSVTELVRSDKIGTIIQEVKRFLKKEKIKFSDKENESFIFEINSEISIGRGLGSSAAFSSATVASLLNFYTGKEYKKETINDLTYEIEKYFHKNPSGVDNTAVVYGGMIYYRKEFEFLKNISRLDFKIPKEIEDNLFLIDSGKPEETTAEMVNLVAKLVKEKPMYTDEIMNDMEKNTKKMTLSLKEKDNNLFQQSLVDNQVLLEMLGTVSEKTKKLLKELEIFGVGKITGAGGKKQGSGFILFFSQKKKELINFLNKKKLDYFKFKPDYQGLIKL